MRTRARWVCAAAPIVVVLTVVCTAVATDRTVVLGTSGWQATWDSSLDPYVSIIVDQETADAVYIQKSAEFIQPPGPGGFPPIPILFQQIAWPAVTQIVIDDEIITNSTGVDWNDFHWDLLDGPDAWFVDGPSFFFSTTPLDNQYFTPDARSFWVDGFGLGGGGSDAYIANGSVWFPGNGAQDGQLPIGVAPHESMPYTAFTLKETPTPEPASLLLVALCLCGLRRR
jgi:hypothetical protein